MTALEYIPLDRSDMRAERAAADLTTGTSALFTVTGLVEIHFVYGTVTEAVENIPCTVKLASGGRDLCATADLDNAATTERVSITGAPATALQKRSANGTVRPMSPGVVVDDDIDLVVGATPATGRMSWEVWWRPLRPGSTLVAA